MGESALGRLTERPVIRPPRGPAAPAGTRFPPPALEGDPPIPPAARGRPAARLWPSATASAHNAPMSTFEIMGMVGMVFGIAGLSLGTLGFIFSVTAHRKINELEARLAKEAPRED